MPLIDVSGDELVYSLHPGQWKIWNSKARFILALGGTQSGKALALDTLIPTPSGMVAIGDLHVGDKVYDGGGQECTVTYVSPVYLQHKCYRIVFDDGTEVVCDAEHQWVTRSHLEARREATPTGKTTQEIANDRHPRPHQIDVVAVRGTEQELPIPPYTLGAWLGDGGYTSATITSADPEVLASIAAEGVPVRVRKRQEGDYNKASGYGLTYGRRGGTPEAKAATVQGRLRTLGVLGNKHIPELYMSSSYAQRLALVQGLMDTDGSTARSGRGSSCELAFKLGQLALDAHRLLRSLGIKVHCKVRKGKFPYQNSYYMRMTFSTQVPVFRLPRKVKLHVGGFRPDVRKRFMRTIERIKSVPVRCIAVDSPSHTYLCTESYIPTHNTCLAPLWLHREMETRGEGDYIAATANYDLFKLKLLPEMLKYFCELLGWGSWGATDRVISSRKDSSRIILRSAESPGGLESATAKAAVLDEFGQPTVPVAAWEAVQRRLSIHHGRALIPTTPYCLGWLKQQVYDRAVGGDKDYEVIQFRSNENPMFPNDEYERMKATLPDWKFQMFYNGVFVRPAGLIYADYIDSYAPQHADGPVDPDNWKEGKSGHLCKAFKIPASWPRLVGVDPGGPEHTALIWLAEDSERGHYYGYREELGGGMSAQEQARAALEYGEPVRLWLGGARSEQDARDTWGMAGVPLAAPVIHEVEAGIDRVIGLFRQKRLFMFETMTRTRSELGTYSRELDPSGNATEKISNKDTFHLLDGLRGIGSVIELDAPVPETVTTPASIRAAVVDEQDKHMRALAADGHQRNVYALDDASPYGGI